MKRGKFFWTAYLVYSAIAAAVFMWLCAPGLFFLGFVVGIICSVVLTPFLEEALDKMRPGFLISPEVRLPDGEEDAASEDEYEDETFADNKRDDCAGLWRRKDGDDSCMFPLPGFNGHSDSAHSGDCHS